MGNKTFFEARNPYLCIFLKILLDKPYMACYNNANLISDYFKPLKRR